MDIEIQPSQPVRPVSPKPPMGWPEATTRIASYAMWAVFFCGWPKIVKQVKVKMNTCAVEEEKKEDEVK